MKYTVILVLIILFIFTICIAENKKEGFESYHNCLSQGYPQNFCLNVPVQSMLNPNDLRSRGLDFYNV